MASGGEKRKRRQRHQSKEQGVIMDRGEHDSSLIESSAPDYPCVTPLEAKKSTKAPSDSDLAEGGGAASQRKSAAERDKREIRVTEPATCQSSSLACISGDQSREVVQSHRLVTSTVTAGEVGRHYARTAAEISPMPDVFGQDEDGDTFLHIAVAQGDQPLTAFFIQRMKSRGIDIYNKLRQTPLHLAVITHQAYMVKKLIEGGADVNLMDRHGQTALHLACQAGDVNCVNAIRDVTSNSRVKIRLELKNSHGFSALHVATFNGSKQLIVTILDMGADIDDQDSNSGRTALHHAVEAGKYQVVEYLISRGADVNKVTFAGNTPLHTASGREMDDMAKLLLRHGANANIANLEGDIPKVVRTSEQAKRQFLSKPTDSKRRKR